MRIVVVVTRPEGRPPIVLGPFLSRLAADARATRLNERFAADSAVHGCAASVEPLDPSSTPIREVLRWAGATPVAQEPSHR